jgi:TolB protein
MGANGRGRRALTSGPASHESPDWSPDGKRIVFVGPAPQSESEPPGGGGIYVMKSNGSGQRWLKTVGDSPVWSPDGSKILFGRGNPGSNSEQLYVMNADGSDIKRLTTGHADFGSAWQPRPAKT